MNGTSLLVATLLVCSTAGAASLDVRVFGARGDGATKDTASIQKPWTPRNSEAAEPCESRPANTSAVPSICAAM